MVQICQTCLVTGDNIFPMSSEDLECYRLFAPKIEDPLDVIYICIYCRGVLRKIIKFIKQCRVADMVLKDSLKRNPKILHKLTSSSLSTSEVTYHYLELDQSDVKIKNEIRKLVDRDNNIPLVLYNKGNDADGCNESRDCAQLDPEMLQKVISTHLSISETIYHYMGPDDNNIIKSEKQTFIDDEDDMPLVMIKQNSYEDSNEYDDLDQPGTPIDTSLDVKTKASKPDNQMGIGRKMRKFKKKKKSVREGFSSRMVTETDEYEVIKLSKEEIIDKMRQHSETEKYKMSPYKCEKCVRGFNFEDVLQTHMEKHSPKNGVFQCELCTQYCPSRVSLRGHMKSHSTRYKCKLCGLIRLSRQHILEHYSLLHTASAALYTCPTCEHTTNKRTAMQRHVRLHSESEPLKCHFCGKYYKSKESLRVHLMRHDDKKLHQCELCSSSFVYAAQLAKHMRAVHVLKDYYCVECDIMFKSMDNLKQHLHRAKRHRDDNSYKFQCQHCAERFISASTLATHRTNAHGAAKSDACPMCPRSYSSAEALRWHVRRVHTPPERAKLPCPLCDRVFTRKYVLRVHMRTHTGERPHACECGATFAQPAALRAHRSAAHKKSTILTDNET